LGISTHKPDKRIGSITKNNEVIKTNERNEIILEALEDYRRWFADDPNGPNESDAEKIREIDAAIDYESGWEFVKLSLAGDDFTIIKIKAYFLTTGIIASNLSKIFH
jgi:hypothetical protein